MDQSVIDQRATIIFDRHKQELLGNIFQFQFLSRLFERAGVEQAGDISAFFVIIAGDSLKAAQYRELTGKSFPPDHLECVRMSYQGAAEFQQEWMKWTGTTAPSCDSGSVPIIIFIGSGHAVLHLDLDFSRLEDFETLEREFRSFVFNEGQAAIRNPEDWFASIDEIAKRASARAESLRRPTLSSSP
ncbi:MAG: hypothetical protein RIS70_4211 [Planctomycetota bacterium]|jgi:hypothetical protein